MKALIPRVPAGSDSRVYLAFAVHNELHDLGEYDESWQALEHACRVKRQLTPHDRNDARRMFEGLMKLCDADFVAAGRRSRRGAPYTPVFIVGMHRSGSTLLEQLLGGHPMVADGGETYSFTSQMRYFADYRNKGVVDARTGASARRGDRLRARRPPLLRSTPRGARRASAVLTEKLPSNFLNLGFIARALPQARILHMVRDPLDTCFSNLRTMFSDVNTFSYDQRELAEWYGQYHRPDGALARGDAGAGAGRALRRAGRRPRGGDARRARVLRPALGRRGRRRSTAPGGAVATASSPQMRGGIIKNRGAAWAPYADQAGAADRRPGAVTAAAGSDRPPRPRTAQAAGFIKPRGSAPGASQGPC